MPFGDDWVNGKPDRLMILRSDPVKRLAQLVSTDHGETFNVRAVICPGTMFNMANVERPTGVNDIRSEPSPSWLYFDGSADYPRDGKIRNNNVYWVNGRYPTKGQP